MPAQKLVQTSELSPKPHGHMGPHTVLLACCPQLHLFGHELPHLRCMYQPGLDTAPGVHKRDSPLSLSCPALPLDEQSPPAGNRPACFIPKPLWLSREKMIPVSALPPTLPKSLRPPEPCPLSEGAPSLPHYISPHPRWLRPSLTWSSAGLKKDDP